MYNQNPGITSHLLQLGANGQHRNVYGQDAMAVAMDHNNEVAVTE